MDDDYDKSTYLTKNPRPRLNVSFRGQIDRNDKLIEKGGDHLKDLSSTNDKFYQNGEQKLQVMERLDKLVPAIDKQSKRGVHNSIYQREWVPDYYDSTKIASVENKIKPAKKGAYVEMKR